MKRNAIFSFLIFIVVGCTNSSKSEIENFEKNFGESNTIILNTAVDNFEKKLILTYPNLSIQESYITYLKDIKIKRELILLDKNIQQKIGEVDFKKEFYFFEKDTITGINYMGKFFIGLEKIKNKDELITTYLRIIKAAGIIDTYDFINGILSCKPDFTNYFHKRIVLCYLYV